MSADEVFSGITCMLHDSLMVLAPSGWAEIDLTVVDTPHGLKVTELATKGFGAKEPRPKPNLRIDPTLEIDRLSEGLTELSQLLHHKGKHWHGGRARVERDQEHADWKLLDPSGAVVFLQRLSAKELGGLIFTDELFAALQASQAAFDTLQSSLEAKLGVTEGYRYDAATARLTLLKEGALETTVPALVIGTYSLHDFTWQWGWANPKASPASVERVHHVCAPDARAPGYSALWRERFACDEGFAWSLASHLVVALGARGAWRGPMASGAGAALFAIMDGPR